MIMNELDQVYAAIKLFEDLRIPVSKEQLECLRKAEGSYIDKEVIPVIEKEIKGKLTTIRNAFTLNFEFDENHNLIVNRVGKAFVGNTIEEVAKPRVVNASNSGTKTFILSVQFPDGKKICHQTVSNTYVDAIQYIGPDKVESLNIKVYGKNIISATLFDDPRYRSAQYDLGNGKYLTTAGNSDRRMSILQKISDMLSLGLRIEKVYL